jgi:hypothetical protein
MEAFWSDTPDFRAPDQPLDWRWRVAHWLVDNGRRPRRQDDRWVRQAVRLLTWRQRHSHLPPTRLRDEDLVPLYQARQLWSAGSPPRWYLQGRLLTFEPAARTAGACGLPVEVVQVYREVYFDLPGREARDYIASRAFPRRRLRQCFEPDDLEGLIAHAGWTGGPLVLNEVFRVLTRADEPAAPPDPSDLEALEAALNDLGARMWVQSKTTPVDDFRPWVLVLDWEILGAYRALRAEVDALRALARLGSAVAAPVELLGGLAGLRGILDELRQQSLAA